MQVEWLVHTCVRCWYLEEKRGHVASDSRTTASAGSLTGVLSCHRRCHPAQLDGGYSVRLAIDGFLFRAYLHGRRRICESVATGIHPSYGWKRSSIGDAGETNGLPGPSHGVRGRANNDCRTRCRKRKEDGKISPVWESKLCTTV